VQTFVAWFLHPPPVAGVPTDGLLAIASVAVVIWTGGFIVRGWMQSTSAALMAGMNYLQFAYFGAILALLSNALTLHLIAVGFLLYYGSFFVRNAGRLRKRERDVELFLPYFDLVRIKGFQFWLALSVIQFMPIIATIVWPSAQVLAWLCVAMTFVGYQIILAFVYSDIFEQTRAGVSAKMRSLRGMDDSV
jgi:hypothetical protein